MSEVKEYIKSKIDGAQIIDYPFPHLLINNFFPEYLYRQMLKEFPAMSGNNGTNYLAPENDNNIGNNIWLQVRDEFYHCLLNFAKNRFGKLYSDRVTELEGYKYFGEGKLAWGVPETGFQLLQRNETFEIAPHIHAPSEYLSVLHYLPEDDANADKGTQLYPIIKSFTLDIPWNTYPHVPKECLGEPVVIPYKANTAVIWLSTFRAIHGRTPTGIQRRYIYAYRLFDNDRVDFSTIDPARNGPLKITVNP